MVILSVEPRAKEVHLILQAMNAAVASRGPTGVDSLRKDCPAVFASVGAGGGGGRCGRQRAATSSLERTSNTPSQAMTR